MSCTSCRSICTTGLVREWRGDVYLSQTRLRCLLLRHRVALSLHRFLVETVSVDHSASSFAQG
jgi:hypothetical protein